MSLVIVIHCIICLLLSLVILMQSGRGGGLTEQFASAESIFGAKTNVFMVKVTAVLAGLFLLTCIMLAYFSSKSNQSLMSTRPIPVGPASLPPGASPSAGPAAPAPAASEPIPGKTSEKSKETAVESQPVTAGHANNPPTP